MSAYLPLKQPIFTPTRSVARRRPVVRLRQRAFVAGAATATAVVLLAGAVFAVCSLGSLRSGEAALVPVPAVAPRTEPMLEVTGLNAARQQGFVTVTGLAENLTAKPLANFEVMVELFDRSGRLLSAEAAPAAITTLSPGEQTPFSVTAQTASEPASYRVRIRKTLGPVLPAIVR